MSLNLGQRIAPPRFVAFTAVAVAAGCWALPAFGWRIGVPLAFDIAAVVFLLSCIPLLGATADRMRQAALRNDANRGLLLVLSAGIALVLLIAIAIELGQRGAPSAPVVLLVVATLLLAWTFANTIYAVHYAHLFYTADPSGKDSGGVDMPGTDEPDYWDFVYFAFTLGMTFQTSDVSITSRTMRRTVTGHCLMAFVFNLGVVAFSVNVLGGS
ncbi:hypothetical protein ASE73_09120 [Sphingomonas sp. Leaf24]|uniref:DUF1345 domain-containing protein n=1 Tax=unclassified Sphingomonas TaxID=196159 RepID=UPI0006FFB679|nr:MULTISPECIES: DUF1345 domain-containing protein [unclassified Sphingomonas]KQM17143.1 hypothetical protein ASE50_07170 [Sphingomonas sp. Leaf5]KQM88035.1 hypothetical protein ASE73_09120 [Sphingomonas sp. Leaf24]